MELRVTVELGLSNAIQQLKAYQIAGLGQGVPNSSLPVGRKEGSQGRPQRCLANSVQD